MKSIERNQMSEDEMNQEISPDELKDVAGGLVGGTMCSFSGKKRVGLNLHKT